MSNIDPSIYVDLVGKPFVSGDRGPNSFDCYGVLLEIYKRQGVNLRDSAYNSADKFKQFSSGICEWEPTDVQPGVTVAFRSGNIYHCGYMISRDRFIHADEGVGCVVISRLNGGALPKKFAFIGAYKPKGK